MTTSEKDGSLATPEMQSVGATGEDGALLGTIYEESVRSRGFRSIISEARSRASSLCPRSDAHSPESRTSTCIWDTVKADVRSVNEEFGFSAPCTPRDFSADLYRTIANDFRHGNETPCARGDSVDPFTGHQNSAANKALLKKQDWRILPLCSIMYLLAFLDRSNIGNAKVMNMEVHRDLMSELNLTGADFATALAFFYVAYTIFEIPSNYCLKAFGAGQWLCGLLVSWGFISILSGFVTNRSALWATRFLLGMFEAGLAPGIVYYVSFWYRPEERSLRLALIFATATLAGAFGGLFATVISHSYKPERDASPWQYLFWVEGALTCIAGMLIYVWFPSFPDDTGERAFLSESEQSLAKQRLAAGGSKSKARNITWRDIREALCDWRLYLHYLVYFAKAVPFSSLSSFAPTIVKGLGYTSYKAQLMTVPPYAVAFAATIVASFYCDKNNKRGLTSGCFMLLGVIGFGILYGASGSGGRFLVQYIGLIMAATGSFATFPLLLGWLSSNLRSTASQGFVLGLNVAIGAPAQIIGVWLYHGIKPEQKWPIGHLINLMFLLVGMTATFFLVTVYHKRNQLIKQGKASGPSWAM